MGRGGLRVLVLFLLPATMLLMSATPVGAQQMAPETEREFAAMLRACTDMMQTMIRTGGPFGMGGMMGMGDMMPGAYGWWWFFQLLTLAAVVGLILWLVLRRPREGDQDALALLKVRLAKGEISVEQYEQTRRALQS